MNISAKWMICGVCLTVIVIGIRFSLKNDFFTMEKLLKIGYPLHALEPKEILKLAAEGKWPPAFVSEEFKRTARP